MVELYKLPGTLTDLVSGIQWAELNAQSGDIHIYTNQTIAAGGTLTSTAIATSSYHSGYLTVSNSGASTNISILVESSTTSEGTIKTPLFSAVLNSTTKTADGAPVAVLPNYIFISAINLDTENPAALSITISL
ncbi:MAG: hypothetical protein WCR86_11915 [Parabacteroides sp.]